MGKPGAAEHRDLHRQPIGLRTAVRGAAELERRSAELGDSALAVHGQQPLADAGGSRAAAQVHLARAIARRAERDTIRALEGDQNRDGSEIRRYLNADSLHYLSQEGMVKATGLDKSRFCMACYDGNYPVTYDPTLDKHIIERRNGRVSTLTDSLDREQAQIPLFK